MSVAKRVANWASNLLVSGVVIVAALTFGRQTMHWWRADDTGLNSRSAVDEIVGSDTLGPEEAAHLLEFGDFPYVFNRMIVRGDGAAALSGLRRHCRQMAERAVASNEPLSPAEVRALAGLESLQPIAEVAGRWQMYENPLPLPMVLVVTPGKDVTRGSGKSSSPPDNAVEVVAPERRVLSWGLAFPRPGEAAKEGQWTLFVWSPGEKRATLSETCPFALPPGSQRTMAMRSEAGGAIVVFRGPGSFGTWQDYVDGWAREQAWRMTQPWQELRGQWVARFEHQNKTTLHVQMTASGEGQLQGLVTVTPPVSAKKTRTQEKTE